MSDLAPNTADARRLFVTLTETINALGECDWNALMDDDETPADCVERAVTLQGLAGMLQSITLAATQTVDTLVSGMVASALANVDDTPTS